MILDKRLGETTLKLQYNDRIEALKLFSPLHPPTTNATRDDVEHCPVRRIKAA